MNKLNSIKGAIFDMDGTLIDSLGFWDVYWKKIGERFLGDVNFKPKQEDNLAVRTVTIENAAKIIHERYNVAKSALELLEFTENLLEWWYLNAVKAKDGVKELLEFLYNGGVKMCIASASPGTLVAKTLEMCGISKYFERMVSCAEVGKGKDEPDVFIKALEYLGTPLDSTFVFEDSVTAILTAHNYGFKTIGIYDDNSFNQDKIKSVVDIYLDKGASFKSLIG